MPGRLVRRSTQRAGRVVPPTARHLRGRLMKLRPGGQVPWHTTGRREELLIVLEGRIVLERRQIRSGLKAQRVSAGECVFIPRGIWHQVINRSSRQARYLYVTG